MGVDQMGVDEMGSRRSGNKPFKHMLKDTFFIDRMIWRRKVKERSGISHLFLSFFPFDTMSVYYNANLKGSQLAVITLNTI